MLRGAAMSSDYTLILRACPDSHRESAAVFIGKLFSLKEHTCQQIVASCPIVLLTGLGREEAAAIHLLVHGLSTVGAQVELSGNPPGDLPKIDWPRRPQVLKRELSEWVVDLQVPVPVPGGQARIIDMLVTAIEGKPATKSEYKGSQLPEVTPFSTPVLAPDSRPPTTRTPLPPPPVVMRTTPPPLPSVGADGGEDPMSRLNELFPDEEGGGFMPGKEDITNILNRILPDEEGGAGAIGSSSGTNRRSGEHGSGGFSVFLAKIADEERRKKAASLISEIGKVPAEEAEALSKKMIIPVLRGVSKDEAEAAKAQFGKIGILARVKGPE
jgi:ribosomal protein L7/L12